MPIKNAPDRKFAFGWLSDLGTKPVSVPKYASLVDNEYVYVNHITETFKPPEVGAKYIGIIVNEPRYDLPRPTAKYFVHTGTNGVVGRY